MEDDSRSWSESIKDFPLDGRGYTFDERTKQVHIDDVSIVPPSKHDVYIRNLKVDYDPDEVLKFLRDRIGGPVSIFFRPFPRAIAVHFDDPEKAAMAMNTLNHTEVLGSVVDMEYYKHIGAFAKRLAQHLTKTSRRTRSRSPISPRKKQSSEARDNGPKNQFERSQNGRNQRQRSREPDGFQRARSRQSNGFQRGKSPESGGFQRARSREPDAFQRARSREPGGFQRARSREPDVFQRARSREPGGFQRARSREPANFQRARSREPDAFQLSREQAQRQKNMLHNQENLPACSNPDDNVENLNDFNQVDDEIQRVEQEPMNPPPNLTRRTLLKTPEPNPEALINNFNQDPPASLPPPGLVHVNTKFSVGRFPPGQNNVSTNNGFHQSHPVNNFSMPTKFRLGTVALENSIGGIRYERLSELPPEIRLQAERKIEELKEESRSDTTTFGCVVQLLVNKDPVLGPRLKAALMAVLDDLNNAYNKKMGEIVDNFCNV